MAHLKGPWAYDGSTHHVVSTVEFHERWDPDEPADPMQVICTLSAMGGDDSRSDLALIVASPELLGMVDRLADRIEADGGSRELVEEARALAARARNPDAVRLHAKGSGPHG